MAVSGWVGHFVSGFAGGVRRSGRLVVAGGVVVVVRVGFDEVVDPRCDVACLLGVMSWGGFPYGYVPFVAGLGRDGCIWWGSLSTYP